MLPLPAPCRWDGDNGPEQTDFVSVRNLVRACPRDLKRFVLTTSAGVERSGQFPFVILNLFGALRLCLMCCAFCACRACCSCCACVLRFACGAASVYFAVVEHPAGAATHLLTLLSPSVPALLQGC